MSVNEPTMEQLEEWMNDDICEAACEHGCIVEPDGVCEHGKESWFLVLGMI